jgi:hypothetical protein
MTQSATGFKTVQRRSARYRAIVNNDSDSAETPSKRTQIFRHVAELPQHGRIAEVAGSWIVGAAERNRARMAPHFPKTLRTLYRGYRTVNRFTNDDAAVSDIERQRHEM